MKKLYQIITGKLRYCFRCHHWYPAVWRGQDWRRCTLCESLTEEESEWLDMFLTQERE